MDGRCVTVHNTCVYPSACTGNIILNKRLIFCRTDSCSLSNISHNLKCFSRQRLQLILKINIICSRLSRVDRTRGEARVGWVAFSPWAAESKERQNGRKNEYCKWEKNFLHSTNFKWLRHIKCKSTNDCAFFLEFVTSVRGDHFYCSPRALKTELRHWTAHYERNEVAGHDKHCNSMKQSPSWEAYSSIDREIPGILWNLKVHCHLHKNPPHVPILNHIIPINAFKSYLFKIYFNSTIPFTPRSSKLPLS